MAVSEMPQEVQGVPAGPACLSGEIVYAQQ